MLFRTFEHYYNDDILINDEINECFICYEVLDKSNILIKLNNKINYIKACNCEGCIHIKCLDKWYESNNSCPVCRAVIIKNTGFTSKMLGIKLYFDIISVFFFKNINKIIRYWFILFFIYFSSNFYLNYFNRYQYYDFKNNYESDNFFFTKFNILN